MIIDDKKKLAADNAPQKDWFLQFLVNLANRNQFELGITLNIGGFLIAGKLVGVKKYFAEFGEDFAASFDAGKSPEEIRTFFKKIGDECACVSHREQSESPSYIHLKDARIINGQGDPLNGDGGVWWRGRLSEVQGFFPGDHFKTAHCSSSGKGET